MSDAPRRIQLKRSKGWRMPANTVKVDRSTRWGNPYRAAQHSRRWAVESFRMAVALRPIGFVYPKDASIRTSLAGKNLACWCPPGAPCHADVLIEIANRPETA